jgi:hypothetical protein
MQIIKQQWLVLPFHQSFAAINPTKTGCNSLTTVVVTQEEGTTLFPIVEYTYKIQWMMTRST